MWAIIIIMVESTDDALLRYLKAHSSENTVATIVE